MESEVRRLVGGEVSADEARALAEWYTALASSVGRFPFQDLRAVEPPLRSVAGPPAAPAAERAPGERAPGP